MDKILSVFAKYENIAGVSGYVQLLESWIKGQHVRVFSDTMCRQDLHGIQVYDGQHVILLSGHECEPSRLIQCDSVRALNAGHRVAANDLHGCRVDYYNLVLLVNGNQNMAGARIVDR